MVLRLCLLGITFWALAACTARPTPRADGVILEDDFSNPQSGWDTYTGVDITTAYDNGRYLIAVETPNRDAFGLAGLDLNDMQISVEAQASGGPQDNAFGVLCRHTRSGDRNNFYFFFISSDGYYAVGKVVNQTERTFLNPAKNFEALAAIKTGDGALNRLEATCQGKRLSFTVNGVAAGSFEDETLTHGDVGLIAGTFNEGGVRIHFDNVVVRQP
ncbi:MAG: hypothetical protein NZM11_03240 [Anaerolineales bacterium]|nr:hypothetical protein [Anaerolineales bacterium]